MKKSNKIYILIFSLILIISVIGVGLVYLYLKTDLFKSDTELFQKYIFQEITNLEKLNQSKINEIKNYINSQNIYETDGNVTFKFSEGGEISNPINDLSFKFKTQKDNEYIYKDAQVLIGDESYLQIEGIKNQEIYGVRFSNALKEFLSIRNTDEGLKNIDGIGIDKNILLQIINFINGDKTIINQYISNEEKQTITDKYFNIIKDSFNNASYSRVKNTLITINENNTVKTNSYIAKLNSDQVKTLIEQLLSTLKSDEIILSKLGMLNIDTEFFRSTIDGILENLGIDQPIPSIQISVYEYNGNTVRTVIETDKDKITMETSNINNEQNLKIQLTNTEMEKIQEYNINIIKSNLENGENYNTIIQYVDSENEYTIELNTEMKNDNGIVSITTKINNKIDIREFEIVIEEKTDTTKAVEKISLEQNNNVILTDLDKSTRERIIGVVKEGLPEIINNKLTTLLEKLQINQLIQSFISQDAKNDEQSNSNQEQPITPNETQIEINRFNAKFEFYTGDEVSSDNVKKLLDVVKNNFKSVEYLETGEIKLNIEKDKENNEQIQLISEKIENNQKYKVSILYKDTNGMIDAIQISKIEKK